MFQRRLPRTIRRDSGHELKTIHQPACGTTSLFTLLVFLSFFAQLPALVPLIAPVFINSRFDGRAREKVSR